MDVLYRKGRATAADIQQSLPDPPSYSAVRSLLKILEDKGHIRHEKDGPRYVFIPVIHHEKAQRSAMRHLIQTFFAGSTEQAVAALLDGPSSRLSEEELSRLANLIEKARRRKR